MGDNIINEALREDRKAMILQLFGEKTYTPMKFKELRLFLSVPKEEENELLEVLDELINEYKIVKSKNNRYMLTPDSVKRGLFFGTKKGFGFVRVEGENEDYFVHEKDTEGALNGDTVLINVMGEGRGERKEAVVTRILERGFSSVIGVFTENKGFGFVIPNNKKISKDIFIPKEAINGAVQGSVVIAEIKDYGDERKSPEGYIKEVIGHIDDPAADIMTVARSYNIPMDFPEDVEEQLKNIPDEVSPEEKEGRRDFRNLVTVTIDGEDAKDLDDAITLTYDGVYHLGVHIADVSNYVKEGSPLDREALKRGTSVYLIDSVIPMIPHKLSNGICSLNHDVDRLTLTCLMDIDDNGKVISHEICEGIINVNERMNYTDVAAILEGKEDAPTKRYAELVPFFKLMAKLSAILREARMKRGSIDFDIAETKIIVDEDHKPVAIKPYDRNVATKIIEDFMLIANETIAEDFFWQELPFEYRVHETPTPEKVEKLQSFIRNFGFYFKVSRDKMHPKEYQKLLEQIRGTEYESLISSITLRSMQQARYSTECMGHFGLACKYYCHFTSPIRRYPDLQIHRIIKDNLNGRLDNKRISHYYKILPDVAADNSAKERRAEEAERDVTRLKEIEYMENHIGEEFEGVVSGFTGQFIFVALQNTVEGTVSVANMTDDYYEFNESEYSMVGKRTGRKFTLGDKVNIKVINADKLERVINFEFTDNIKSSEGETK